MGSVPDRLTQRSRDDASSRLLSFPLRSWPAAGVPALATALRAVSARLRHRERRLHCLEATTSAVNAEYGVPRLRLACVLRTQINKRCSAGTPHGSACRSRSTATRSEYLATRVSTRGRPRLSCGGLGVLASVLTPFRSGVPSLHWRSDPLPLGHSSAEYGTPQPRSSGHAVFRGDVHVAAFSASFINVTRRPPLLHVPLASGRNGPRLLFHAFSRPVETRPATPADRLHFPSRSKTVIENRDRKPRSETETCCATGLQFACIPQPSLSIPFFVFQAPHSIHLIRHRVVNSSMNIGDREPTDRSPVAP